MDFDLTDLRLFVLAAEELNLTRAAARQHLSLAAASARVKALETQSGLPLFVRESRGLKLTAPGEAFLHHARGVLRQVNELANDLHDYSGGLRGHLRVLANTTAVSDFMPEILPGFLSANPRINIDLQERPNAEIARGVAEGRADLGIVAGQVDRLGLQSIHFSTDRLVLVTSQGHGLAGRKSIAFADTLDEDMVGMHHASTLQTFLAGESDKLGKPMKLRVQLAGFDAMCRMVGAAVGVAIIPASAALRNRAALKLSLVELTDAWNVRERHVLARDFAQLPPYAANLVDALVRYHRPASGG